MATAIRPTPERANGVVNNHQLVKLHKKTVPYTTLVAIYDECSMKEFGRLHSLFYSLYWAAAITVIILTTISGSASVPGLSDGSGTSFELSIITFMGNIIATIIVSAEKIVNLSKTAEECSYARAELQYHLADKSDMPVRSFERISKIKLLWFQHPSKCNYTVQNEARV